MGGKRHDREDENERERKRAKDVGSERKKLASEKGELGMVDESARERVKESKMDGPGVRERRSAMEEGWKGARAESKVEE